MKHAIANILRAVAERLDPQPVPVQQTLRYTVTACGTAIGHMVNGTLHGGSGPPARF